jgi:hypothetical protein
MEGNQSPPLPQPGRSAEHVGLSLIRIVLAAQLLVGAIGFGVYSAGFRFGWLINLPSLGVLLALAAAALALLSAGLSLLWFNRIL